MIWIRQQEADKTGFMCCKKKPCHLHTKWQANEIDRPVYKPMEKYPIYWNQWKAWISINRVSIRVKSDLHDKIKWKFFQAVVVLVLLCECTTETLRKCLEKKLDGNNTRMLRAVSNNLRGNTPQNNKTALPLSSYLTNHPCRISNTCRTQLEKQERTDKRQSLVNSHTWTHHCWLTNIKQPYAERGCILEYLSRTSADGERERVKGICAISTRW